VVRLRCFQKLGFFVRLGLFASLTPGTHSWATLMDLPTCLPDGGAATGGSFASDQLINVSQFLGRDLLGNAPVRMVGSNPYTDANGYLMSPLGVQMGAPLRVQPDLPPVNYYVGGPLPGAIQPGDFVAHFDSPYLSITDGQTTVREWNAPWNRVQPIFETPMGHAWAVM